MHSIKSIFFLVLGLVLILINATQAQSHLPLIERKLTLNSESIKLNDALLLVSKICDFNLSYNANLIKGDSLISVKSRNTNPIRLLRSILPDHVTVKYSGNNVVLLYKPIPPGTKKEKEKLYAVSGRVIDSKAAFPLESATVLNLSNSRSVNTNMDGAFTLLFPSNTKELSISISKAGFRDTVILLNPADHNISIPLDLIRERILEPELEKINNISPEIDNSSISKLILPELLVSNSENIQGYTLRGFQASMTPGLSSNLKIAGAVKNKFSLNVLGGYSYGVEFLEIGGLLNMTRRDVSWVQIAGVSNLVGGNVKGTQVAGVYNHTGGNQIGLQIAGAANMVEFHQKGVQIAGAANLSRGDVYGIQIASGLNYTGADNFGWQIAAGANIIQKKLKGIQLAAGYNQCKSVYGLQLSAGLNLTDTLNGVQIGLLNLSGTQKGFQLGLINMIDSSEGLSLGLLNVVRKNGYQSGSLSSSELHFAKTNIHFGTTRFYNIFTIGMGGYYGPGFLSAGIGLGSRRTINQNNFMHFEVCFESIFQKSNTEIVRSSLLSASFNWSREIFPNWHLFGGPSFNFLFNNDEVNSDPASHLIAPYNLFKDKPDLPFEGWIGGSLGIRFEWSNYPRG
ncbi:MAG: hypothetical protein IPI60_04615 [Saprospiraceae bacterium]|nr:hypothetical protein [Saprospiraceae bacterium]